MDTASPILIFGAGCIGRGLLGEQAAAEGRPLVLVEAAEALAAALDTAGGYTVELVGREYGKTRVDDFRVLTPADTGAIGRALSDCAFAATAVGGMNLDGVARVMAPLLDRRKTPLNILVCENWLKADERLSDALVSAGTGPERFACIPCSVERIVKALPHSLDLLGESGESAWMDSSKWIGGGPCPGGLHLCDNLGPYYARKLYTNNAGHALLAYEGFLAGHGTLPDAVGDPSIRSRLMELLKASEQMLTREYGLDPRELTGHSDNLVRHRFANQALADPVERVARQPLRKLGPDERMVGLLRKLERHGLPIRPVCRTIAAALCYADPGDDESRRLQEMIRSTGPEQVLQNQCGMKPGEAALRICLEEWATISKP